MIVAKLRIYPYSMDDKIVAAAKNLVFGHIHPLMNEWCTLLGHFVCIALVNHLFNEKHPH